MGDTLNFFLLFLGSASGSERKKTSAEKQNSRREGRAPTPAGPEPGPVCPAPRPSPAGGAGAPAPSPPRVTRPRALSRESAEGLQAEGLQAKPPRRSSIPPQAVRDQTPESQTVGVMPLLPGASPWTAGEGGGRLPI